MSSKKDWENDHVQWILRVLTNVYKEAPKQSCPGVVRAKCQCSLAAQVYLVRTHAEHAPGYFVYKKCHVLSTCYLRGLLVHFCYDYYCYYY